ncbi:hypothetical protein GCM10027084_13930 [Pseudoxanthomonas sangjuensis]|uniref:hypothetical protein n=1 Tax=Pseudoxanthomonas sangjuensis TaxID=1503750 RepID=UPI001390BC7D|nr:hypothetical protein [Pseudoxanthomonas sangjuensis]
MPASFMVSLAATGGEDDRLRLVRLLLGDRAWRCPQAVRWQLLRVLAGTPGPDEAAWMTLAEETAHYLDFLRMAKLEAQLRGCPRQALRFTREDWERAKASGTVSACIGEFHCHRPRRASSR